MKLNAKTVKALRRSANAAFVKAVQQGDIPVPETLEQVKEIKRRLFKEYKRRYKRWIREHR